MKIPRTELIRALETALGPAELEHERSPLVAFFPTPGGARLRGQTGEGAGWDSVATDVPLAEPFLVPGRPVLQTLKEIRDDHIELSLQAQELHLAAGGYRAVLWTRPASSPAEPSDDLRRISLESNLVGDLGALVAYARPKGRNKSVFPGIHLQLGPRGLRIVATDGRRLAMASSDTLTLDETATFILPGRFLLLASRHLEAAAPTELHLGSSHVALVQGDRGVAGTVLAGPMPSYRALLPAGVHHRGCVRRGRLIEATRQARLFSPRALIQLEDDKLFLSTSESTEGMAEVSIGIEWSGALYRAQFNTDELLEALENLPGDEVGLEVQGERAPVVLRGSKDVLATLMPLLW